MSLHVCYGVLSVIPEMVVEPKNEITVEDSNATFNCNASGVPEPVITWSFSRGPLPQNIATKYSLTLLSVNNSDLFEGNYTCHATNRAGYDTRTAHLIVDGMNCFNCFTTFRKEIVVYFFKFCLVSASCSKKKLLCF